MKQYAELGNEHIRFINDQHVFFTASAAQDGRVNISPRPTDAIRVSDPHTIMYRDLTGSRNETAAHLRLKDRLTLMFCAFAGPPNILRLYGKGRVLPRESSGIVTF